MVEFVPNRGNIVWLEFEPQKGKKIQKTRPALIISPKVYNEKVGLALCMLITSKIKNYPFEVKIENKMISGAILSDQLRSLDWKARKAKLICKCDKSVYSEVIEKLHLLIE